MSLTLEETQPQTPAAAERETAQGGAPELPGDWLIDARGVSKKYCRDLQKSLWYGARDVLSAAAGRRPSLDVLRPAEFWAVRDVSLHLCRGEALGLLGRNGAGKSTLLKMIAGQRSLTTGSIATRGRMVAMTELGLGFHLAPRLSDWDRWGCQSWESCQTWQPLAFLAQDRHVSVSSRQCAGCEFAC